MPYACSSDGHSGLPESAVVPAREPWSLPPARNPSAAPISIVVNGSVDSPHLDNPRQLAARLIAAASSVAKVTPSKESTAALTAAAQAAMAAAVNASSRDVRSSSHIDLSSLDRTLFNLPHDQLLAYFANMKESTA
ncbi:unnamed protein product [Protopolystoma xenopodis]|uniref:Uncharacterized protein n=1 Tax=Protopolystoma xenopodis TaxID=117903 RepID=A0A3S5BNW5_9PLAT|nr:unnamed protein product [Protopolystoma xenopodis]